MRWTSESGRLRRGSKKILGRVALARSRRKRRVYRSPQEIALRNAAEELGVGLGEYYPQDVDLRDPRSPLPAERLDASREELLLYIERLAAGRQWARRRRRYAVIAVGVLGLATVGLSVASPWEETQEGVHATRAEILKSIPPRLRGVGHLGPGGISVEVSVRDGPLTLIGSAYVDTAGDVCSALIRERQGVQMRRSGGGCLSTDDLAARLRRKRAMIVGWVTGKECVLVQGFASADLEMIIGREAAAGIDAAVSEPWTPRLGSAPRIRSFLVRVPMKRRIDVLDMQPEQWLLAVFSRRGTRPIPRSASRDHGFLGRRLVDPILR